PIEICARNDWVLVITTEDDFTIGCYSDLICDKIDIPKVKRKDNFFRNCTFSIQFRYILTAYWNVRITVHENTVIIQREGLRSQLQRSNRNHNNYATQKTVEFPH